MQEAIITGASGFIGARIALRLLQQGWSVTAIGRRANGTSWPMRMVAALDDIRGAAVEKSLLTELHCCEVELTSPDLGLTEAARRQLQQRKAVLFHVAGDTRFNPPDPQLQLLINVDGALNVVRALAESLTSVVHVSTAYVSGARQELIKEDDLEMGQSFRNCYEKSKLAGELAITKLCRELSISLSIVRPSVIINDTETGRSSTFTHLNALVDVVRRLQEHFGLGRSEVVSEEIRIMVDPGGRPNLAQIDPMIEALLQIALHPEAPGRTYHLCHPCPQTNTEIVELLTQAFEVKDKVNVTCVDELPEDVSHTEKMIARSFKPYLPYLNDRSSFDLTNTISLVPEYVAMFPALDVDYINKVIDFQHAVDQDDNPVH